MYLMMNLTRISRLKLSSPIKGEEVSKFHERGLHVRLRAGQDPI